ncbi:hypothetical protein [Altericista sp. CCNU0014]|uniref:hypothetical protein n=1 Tax=Altericista sp. CCNU0014 TaxID=3082949 RepID=UPI0038511F08
MNLSLLRPVPVSTLTWHILLETLDRGQIAAWVAEFPECKVVAESQDAAILALEDRLNQRMASIQVMPLQLSSGNPTPPWSSLCGILKDDVSFAEWSDRFWAQKQRDDIEEDEILSVEDSLSTL